MSDAGPHQWKVGELASATGLTVRALHHYDELGLLVPPERSFAGYRLYGDADVERLYRIVALRRLGLRLDAIAGLLNGRGLPLSELLDRQLAAVDRQIAEAARLRERLTTIRDALGDDTEPSIDQLIETMEAMTMHEKYYTPEQLERLERRRDELGQDAIEAAQREWGEVFAALRAEMEVGTDPSDPKLDRFRQRSRALLHSMTGGDPDIRASMSEMLTNEDPAKVTRGMVDRELWEYYMRMWKTPSESSA